MAGGGDREVEVSFCEAGPGKCRRSDYVTCGRCMVDREKQHRSVHRKGLQSWGVEWRRMEGERKGTGTNEGDVWRVG